jgi:hypothetical protein
VDVGQVRGQGASTSPALAWRGMGMPKKFFTWLQAMSTAAPAVKPTTTVCDTKFTSTPMRSRPQQASCTTPTSRLRVSARLTKAALPGSASGLSVASTTMEMAVVGPDTRCHDDPNSAATMAGTMAAYRPYSGGMPAMVAKATPCGTRMMLPVRPAIRSARSVWRSTRCHQRRMGSQARQSKFSRGRLIGL